MHFYNYERLQVKLNSLSPIKFSDQGRLIVVGAVYLAWCSLGLMMSIFFG
ncbi:hypothetical protein [Paenibacillus azoreducens]